MLWYYRLRETITETAQKLYNLQVVKGLGTRLVLDMRFRVDMSRHVVSNELLMKSCDRNMMRVTGG